jgi:hydroxymethylbilane synthase
LTRERVLRIGTRGSRLALWQAHAVSNLLQSAGVRTEIVVIKTTGDRSQDAPATIQSATGIHKRQFVKELEDALLNGEVDLAVHSAKDMPVDLPEGLAVAACLPREDPLDGLILPQSEAGGETAEFSTILPQLPADAIIGTSSVRRIAQLARLIPGATFKAVRGNVDTRLGKLDAENFDALVLACAGLRRLGFGGRISAAIPVDQCVPAPGQGIVATEIRADNQAVRVTLDAIHDASAGRSLAAERALVAALGGGCQLPLGAIALPGNGTLHMHALVASLDGAQIVRGAMSGPEAQPVELGKRLADDLAASGAREILDALR